MPVHILRHGRTLCGMPGVPADWPEGHKWVGLNDEGLADDATCRKCIRRLLNPEVTPPPVYKKPMTLRHWIHLSLAALGLVIVITLGYQPFKVWSSKLDGEAKFAEAEYSRRVTVLEAQAKLDSAGKLAEAEVARARGVAQANKIIGDSLHENEDYLKYLWINQLEQNKNSVIYVPTEANLPILEAQRLSHLPGDPPPPPPEHPGPAGSH